MHWWMLPVWFFFGWGLNSFLFTIVSVVRRRRDRKRFMSSLEHAYVGPSAVADISEMGPYRTPTAPSLSSSYCGSSTDVVVQTGDDA